MNWIKTCVPCYFASVPVNEPTNVFLVIGLFVWLVLFKQQTKKQPLV